LGDDANLCLQHGAWEQHGKGEEILLESIAACLAIDSLSLAQPMTVLQAVVVIGREQAHWNKLIELSSCIMRARELKIPGKHQ
jgi:hypothetical protein